MMSSIILRVTMTAPLAGDRMGVSKVEEQAAVLGVALAVNPREKRWKAAKSGVAFGEMRVKYSGV